MDPRLPSVDAIMFFTILDLLIDAVLGGRIRVQYSDPDLPGLIRSHPGIAFRICWTLDAHDEGDSQRR